MFMTHEVQVSWLATWRGSWCGADGLSLVSDIFDDVQQNLGHIFTYTVNSVLERYLAED